MYVHVTRDLDTGNILEVFITHGKTGNCAVCQLSALAVAITIGIRCGVDPALYADRLQGIKCPNQNFDPEKGKWILSCADGVGMVLKEALWETVDEIEEGEGP